jgi:uncharacterized protein (TIGR02145 family)
MKNPIKSSGIFLLILSVFLIHSCKKDKSVPPVVTTTTVTGISYTTAVSGGEVTYEGGAPVVSRGICWSTSADPTTASSKTTDSVGLGAFISNITQLTPNTKYYVRAYATNKSGTGYGDQVTFTTSQVAVPALTTAEVTSITQGTAVSGGNITSENGSSITARGVCWSTLQNPTTSDSKTSDGTGTGVFTSVLTGLIGNTIYYVRPYATNSAGTQYGSQISFKTSPVMPTLSTKPVSSITVTFSKSGGDISSDGGASVTARGVCWSTSQNPTISDSKTDNGSGIGTFTSSLIGLTGMTTYYVRAYATNSIGTSYGNELNFKTYEIADLDSNGYNTIIIGTQTWMAENLKTTRYNDGTSIPLVTDTTIWVNLSTAAYCWYNNDSISNKATYGALYNWYTVNSGNLCPTGWHVPTDAEFNTLELYLGVPLAQIDLWGWHGTDQGAQMKNTTGWNAGGNGTNTSGFSALPGGYTFYANSSFYAMGIIGVWWSSTEDPAIIPHTVSWYRRLDGDHNDIYKATTNKKAGISVRCLKD